MIGDAGIARCLAGDGLFGIGIRWFPLVLGRHYTLLDVNTGWPRLGFPVGSVSGVSLSGLPLPGFLVGVAIWLPLGLDF